MTDKVPAYQELLVGALLGAILSFAATSYFHSDDRRYDELKQRGEYQNELMKELFPKLDALRLPDRGTFIEASMGLNNRNPHNLLRPGLAALDTLDIGAELTGLKLAKAFDSTTAAEFHSLRHFARDCYATLDKWSVVTRKTNPRAVSSSSLDIFYRLNGRINEFKNRVYLSK